MNNYQLPKPHRRQFVIGSAPFQPYPNWCCRQINAATWLSYCPDLRITWGTDSDGITWILLGLAIETTTNIAPMQHIAQLSSQEVVNSYCNWAGRWLLIGNGQIHLDANGLLGCFYGVDTQAKLWISSSPALLAAILAPVTSDTRSLIYGRGISWYTPPRSRFLEIKRLLASQILDFTTGQVIPRSLMPEINLKGDYTTTIELVRDSLVIALHNLGQLQQPLWLGLTAGYDSRLMLAIAKSAQINFTAFTRIAQRMSLADRILPPKLANQLGIPHILLRNQPPQEQLARKQLVQAHSAGNVSQGDAEPFIMGVRDRLSGIAFGGHGFAIASGFHTLRQLPANFISPAIGAAQIAELFNEPTDSTATQGLATWLTWVESHPQPNLDWRDRFFLEQRQAGWLSSKEQVYDLTNLARFPILNAARIYALLLSIPESQRLGSLVQVALLKQLAPELLDYPFNPPDTDFNFWSKIWYRKIRA
ncbi:MAG TPA: hypothetical protein ACFCUY_02785 [Xenococcaceae cyanobacterium]|jgi:hypothetical protein